MPKAYFVACYREITDPAKLAAYGKLAAPAIEAAGGRFLARGMPTHVYEDGRRERTVIVEFESLAQGAAAYASPAYQAALAALGDGAVRDIRLIEGA
ncbi:MAG TPA: DUF1330 domain-containing protein [Steroidobacteraceae bacterium]|nr:DUF1330 domain-containing protein [Steroidobacteraceae bacterium]